MYIKLNTLASVNLFVYKEHCQINGENNVTIELSTYKKFYYSYVNAHALQGQQGQIRR